MTRRRNKAVGAAGARRERAGGAAPPEPPAPPAGPGLPETPEVAAAVAAAASGAEQGRASQVLGARAPISPAVRPEPASTPLCPQPAYPRIHRRGDPPFSHIGASAVGSPAFSHPE